VCTGRATTILELAEMIAKSAGRDAEVSYHPARIGDIHQSIGDPRAAAKAFGITAVTLVKDGLVRTLADLKNAPALADRS
jgi:UDP-glucose 4-epimerase